MKGRVLVVVLVLLLGALGFWRVKTDKEERARAEELELGLRRIENERVRKLKAEREADDRMRAIYK